ncbi:MAG: IctB family putative bicarbonate transporter [Leptolyngbyaceae cyanobacterium HOT.MB2.61]|jgi:putative inorganic carbon (HCO3(-)) transporter|nr:IctB family putative bicarbonate transporter [Leptolyngbyaceae cyanobacterium HOT.MB2.61]
MNSFWQRLTLSTLPLQQWWSTSYLHRLVGLLRSWRKDSRLMQYADLIGAGLVCLVFGLAPFISNTLIGILLIACGAYWVLLTISDDWEVENRDRQRTTDQGQESSLSPVAHRPSPNTPIHLLVLLYWSIATVATALSPVKKLAFVGWSKLTLYLLFFALMARVLRSPRVRSWVIGIYLHVALLVSSYGIYQKIYGVKQLANWVDPTSPTANKERVYSYLGNPNLLGGYLLPAIAFSLVAIFAWQHWGPKLLAVFMLGLNLACLYFTDSRGAWIGFVCLGIVLLFLLIYWWSNYLPKFWRIWALPLALGGFVGAIVLGVLVLEPLRDRVSSMFLGRGDSSNNFRINVWMSVIEMIKDRPILGIGPGNTAFNRIYPLYQRPRFSALSAYSVILEVAVETGLIGLACFLWLLLVTFTQGWIQLTRLRELADRQGCWLIAALASLVGMLGHGLFDTVLYRPEINTLWWLMIALIASYYSGRQGKGVDEWASGSVNGWMSRE